MQAVDTNETSKIFDDSLRPELLKLRVLERHIKVARLVLFVVSSIFLVRFCIRASDGGLTNGLWADAVLPVCYMLIAFTTLLSYVQPFIFLLISTLVYTFVSVIKMVVSYRMLSHGDPVSHESPEGLVRIKPLLSKDNIW